MNRIKSMICYFIIALLTDEDKAAVFDMVEASIIESDCLTTHFYIDREDVKDQFLEWMKAGKVVCVSGFPRRYKEDVNGSITDKDGVKYSKLTQENLKDAKGITQKIEMPVEKIEVVSTKEDIKVKI